MATSIYFVLRTAFAIHVFMDRRGFLKNGAVGLAATNLFPHHLFASALPSPELIKSPRDIDLPSFKSPKEGEAEKGELGLSPDERVGFAILGLGNISLTQAMPAIVQSKRAKITAVISGSPDKAKKIAHSYGVDRIYDYKNLEEIAKNKDIKAVYVATPNSTHLEFVTLVAQAGKHILCEKPMATNVEDCATMIAACKKAGVKLMLAYRQQYEPYNTIVKKILQQKTFGKTKNYAAHLGQNMGDASQWRLNLKMAGGGPLPDMGIYPLNACRFHKGQEPVEVFATLQENKSDKRFREVEEGVVWQMRFADGLTAHCSTNYSVHQQGSFRYFAENGWFGMSPAFIYQGGKLEVGTPDDKLDLLGQPYFAEKNQFVLEFEHFCDAVLENKKIQSGGEEGMQDMKIIAAIYDSAKRRQPVHIS